MRSGKNKRPSCGTGQLTPRPYLSHSQMDLILKNPEGYWRKYFYGENKKNKFTEFGKKVAEELERYEEQSDLIALEAAKVFLPDYPLREKKAKLTAVTGDGIPLLGFPDALDLDKRELGENKTSKNPWTQSMADSNNQLTFYAIMLKLQYGWLPKIIRLHWFETREDGDEMCLTGHHETFETTRNTLAVIRMHSEIKKAWELILEMSQEEYGKI